MAPVGPALAGSVPSPRSQVTEDSVAVAWTSTPGTSTLDCTGVQEDPSTHNQAGTPTT
jgi:hypothetical protein